MYFTVLFLYGNKVELELDQGCAIGLTTMEYDFDSCNDISTMSIQKLKHYGRIYSCQQEDPITLDPSSMKTHISAIEEIIPTEIYCVCVLNWKTTACNSLQIMAFSLARDL